MVYIKVPSPGRTRCCLNVSQPVDHLMTHSFAEHNEEFFNFKVNQNKIPTFAERLVNIWGKINTLQLQRLHFLLRVIMNFKAGRFRRKTKTTI